MQALLILLNGADFWKLFLIDCLISLYIYYCSCIFFMHSDYLVYRDKPLTFSRTGQLLNNP
jgi:hypothetical protein